MTGRIYKTPSKEDWNYLRPRIEQLYKVEKRKINDTVNILVNEYGFRITERMLRQRIKQWNLMKNRKKSEVDAALRILREFERAGTSAPGLQLREEPISIADVRDFYRKKLPPGQTVEDIPTPTRSQAPTPVGLERQTPARQTTCTAQHITARSEMDTTDGPTLTPASMLNNRFCNMELSKWLIDELLFGLNQNFESVSNNPVWRREQVSNGDVTTINDLFTEFWELKVLASQQRRTAELGELNRRLARTVELVLARDEISLMISLFCLREILFSGSINEDVCCLLNTVIHTAKLPYHFSHPVFKFFDYLLQSSADSLCFLGHPLLEMGQRTRGRCDQTIMEAQLQMARTWAFKGFLGGAKNAFLGLVASEPEAHDLLNANPHVGHLDVVTSWAMTQEKLARVWKQVNTTNSAHSVTAQQLQALGRAQDALTDLMRFRISPTFRLRDPKSRNAARLIKVILDDSSHWQRFCWDAGVSHGSIDFGRQKSQNLPASRTWPTIQE